MGLGFFLRLEAAGEGFVGGGVWLVGVGVGVVGGEISGFFVGIGAVIVASCSAGIGGRAGWWCEVLGWFGGDFVLGFAGDGVYVVAGWVCEFLV